MEKNDYIIIRPTTEKIIRWLDTEGETLLNCLIDEPSTFEQDDEIYKIEWVGWIDKKDNFKIVEK